MSEQNNTYNTCTVTTSIQIHVNGLKECITICKYTGSQIMLIISKKNHSSFVISWRQHVRSARNRTQWFNMGNTLSVYELHKDIKIIYIILASALFYSKLLSYHGDPLQSIIFIIGCMWYDWLIFIFLAKKSEEIFLRKVFRHINITG